MILASGSPRRKALFHLLVPEFEVRKSDIQESIDPDKSPTENVIALSYQKAQYVARHNSEGLVIGVDTVVVLDDKIMGKPHDPPEALTMLRALSGREHIVFTGFTILELPGERRYSDVEETRVRFRTLEDSEIQNYVRSGVPLDKAGAYGIQDDFGAVFVEGISGCFYNVVGLPLTKLYVSLRNFVGQ